MELEKTINGRRSVRDYLDNEIPEELVGDILKAGAMAPSARDMQPCRFIVIRDRRLIKELSDKVKDKAKAMGAGGRMELEEDVIFYGAPLLILVVAEKGKWAETDCALP